MIRGAAGDATEPVAADAVRAALAAGGSAVDAVLAGFFAAAGADAGVLLAPVVALVAGAGAGARVFDGRAAQPGHGAARPRGFLDAGAIPAAARVAAPRSLGLVALLHGLRGRARLEDVVRPGVTAARERGADARAKLIQRVGAQGVLALRAPELQRAVLAVAGSVVGGLFTALDLEEPRPGEAEAATRSLPPRLEGGAVAASGDDAMVISAPFPVPPGPAHAVVAIDARGLAAALSYAPASDGVSVPAFEIRLPGGATPVRRGVQRVPAGTVIASPAPIALVMRGSLALALGGGGSSGLAAGALDETAAGPSIDLAITAWRERLAGTLVAALGDGRVARAI